jgi:hypothetical protein
MCPPLSDNWPRDGRKSLEGGQKGKSLAVLTRVTHHAVPKRRCRNAYSSQAAQRSRRS